MRASTAHSSTELLPLLQSAPGPVFTMGDEMVDETLRWTEGLPIEEHMGTGTRTFYAFVLAARLVDLIAAQSPRILTCCCEIRFSERAVSLRTHQARCIRTRV